MEGGVSSNCQMKESDGKSVKGANELSSYNLKSIWAGSHCIAYNIIIGYSHGQNKHK